MAKRRRKSKRRSTARKKQMPGWVWMLFGLAVGLSVAAAVYVKDRGASREVTEPPQAASMVEEEREPEPRQVETPAASESRFDFYEMLPRFEVIVPEEEPEARPDNRPELPAQPGTYVLQAGSFSTFEDADRMKARLALQGIPSRIQRVAIDDREYHRVRIGPVSDMDELDDLRRRLREARIEVLMIRMPPQ